MHNDKFLINLSDFFKLFGDPTRLKILKQLLEGEKCVKEIAEAIGISQSAVSHQLSTLRTLNVVKTNKTSRNVNYQISDEHIAIILKYGTEHIKELIEGEKNGKH